MPHDDSRGDGHLQEIAPADENTPADADADAEGGDATANADDAAECIAEMEGITAADDETDAGSPCDNVTMEAAASDGGGAERSSADTGTGW